MRTVTVILLLTSAFSMRLSGQADSAGQPSGSIDKAYVLSYWTNFHRSLSAPARWNYGEWVAGSLVVGSTLFLITQDEAIRDLVQRNRPAWADDASDYFFSPLGSGLITLPALGAFYGYGLLAKDQKAKNAALEAVEAFVISGVIAQAVKQLTHRHRPYQDEVPDPWNWDGPFSSITYTSFPSGHAATAFAVAAVLATTYRETVWVPVVSYSLASLVGVSRVVTDKHWASDVLAGAAIGYAVGKLVCSVKSSRISIVPVSSTGYGATLIWKLD